MSPETQRRLAQIALVWAGKLGPRAFRRVTGHFGSPQAALAASWEELALPSLRLDPEQIEAILGRAQDLDHVRRVLQRLEEQNIAVRCDWEEDYPRILREMPDAPPVLCWAGRLLPRDEPAVAIVGTRTPTREGLAMAEALGRACAAAEITVVSGLALGCDTAAHQGALEGGGRTVAVLGSGIVAISPRQNLELAREIAEHGAVLSEAPPGAQPSAPRLLARNRLQVGLSRAVIVVQAGETGGAMQTAERARKTNRLVCAVAWPAGTAKSEGNAALLRTGARALTGPGEIPNLIQEVYVHQEQARRERAAAAEQLFGGEKREAGGERGGGQAPSRQPANGAG
jgi:DNA processing protein